MEVLLLFFSQAELAWIPWKLEKMWFSAHLAMPIMEGISLKTKPRRSCTTGQQSKEHRIGHIPWMMVSLRQNQLCGLWGTNRIYFCGGMLKHVRPWGCCLSVFILSAADKYTKVSGKSGNLFQYFCQVCETLTPVKAIGSKKHELEIVSTPGKVFHLHHTWHA